MLTLTALNGQEKGREFRLTGDAPELLGRQAPKLQLADAQASRKHAEVLLENNTWLIRDLDSTNGTWVNGQKIMQITELEVGDRIVIGRHQFRVSAIDDLPAPSPKPSSAPPEPMIGDEVLGEMGVDLGESLSADLLDNEALDLPEVPESAIDEEPAPPTAEQAPEPTTAQAEEPDDGVIDLDALLDNDTDDEQSQDTGVPQETEEVPEEDVEPPAPPSSEDEQGVIDLDDLLNDGPTTSEEEAAVEIPTDDEPAAIDEPDTPEPVEAQGPETTPEASASDENVDFDLDELLGGELQNEPATPEPEEAVNTEEVAEGLGASEDSSDDVVEGDSASPDELPDSDGLDSIEDIDAMLEDLGADEDGPEEAAPDEPDVLADATPPPVVTSEDENDPGMPDLPVLEDSAEEASKGDAPDSLIDIDILAAASTAAAPEFRDSDSEEEAVDDTPSTVEPEGDATPDADEAVTSDVLDAGDSGPLPEDSDIFDSTDSDAGLEDKLSEDHEDSAHDLPDAEQSTIEEPVEPEGTLEPQLTSDADDEADSSDDDGGVDEPLASDLDDEAELQEAERELLLTQEEQSEAVAGYKRSKLMTLGMGVLILAVVIGGGWYAVGFFTDEGDAAEQATQTPAAQINQSEPDVTTSEEPEETPEETPPETGRVAIPDIKPPEPKVGIVKIPDIPAKEAPAETTNEDTTLDVPVEPAPEVSESPTVDETEATDVSPANSTKAPDPFEDVETSVFDLPPADEAGPTETPEKVAFGTSDTRTELTGTDATEVAPVEPEPTNTTDPIIDTPAETHGGVPADTDTPAEAVIETTEATANSGVSDSTNNTDPNAAQLDLLAGVIDAQNKPGTGVNEEAAFADARRVVYLVDASGSLVDSFPRVLNELSMVIDTLEDGEAFTALFFGADGVTEIPPVGLKWADRQNKRDARNWIDPENGNVNAWGRGDLMQALRRATEYGADEVVIFSDNLVGRKPTQEAIDTLLEDIAGITGEQVQKIHVIQFFTRDPKQVLKTIAERFNGTYSLIPAIAEPSAEGPGGDLLLFP